MNLQPVLVFIIMLAVGAVVGFAVSWLIGKVRYSGLVPHSEIESKNQEIAGLKAHAEYLAGMEGELKAEREKTVRLSSELSSRNTQIQNLEKVMAERKKEIEDLNAKFSEEFRKTANQLLLSNANAFNQQTTERLSMILNPLKEQIKDFEKKIDVTRNDQTRDSSALKVEIKKLTELNQQMSEETRNLTSALRSESKTRGNWGEMILETILEKSGLIKGEHYELQKAHRDENGRMLKPDVIIHMPENKHLVIDSKVSLVAYEQYCTDPDLDRKSAFLKAHCDAMKTHVVGLSGKNYQALNDIAPPDFVLMFVPIEPAFSAALEFDRSLFQFALDRNVVMLTPSTLIPTLRIIQNIWRQENQNRNAQQIAETGGRLYDKFAGFVEDMNSVDVNIGRTRDCFDSAMKKLSTGRGNLISMAEKMKSLGAKTAKQIPADQCEDE